MPTTPADPGPVHERRHPEWAEHYLRWRWLLDSWEGGEAYRLAVYGSDTRGLPVRNLIRHKREYPEGQTSVTYTYPNASAGYDQYSAATDDDYTLRLARTPVPAFVASTVDTHLSGIYAHEVERETTDDGLQAWWEDVDGAGTTVDEWVTGTVAPLLMALGCLDVIVDHPYVPPGVPVETRADEMALGLDSVVASVILPENMVWWVLGLKGEYLEALVCELQDDGCRRFRHWTASDWTLYEEKGGTVDAAPHPFGRVPIVRLFDGKRARCKHVGKPRYESTAENQREYYNRDSELILSDTTQAHPLLQGPEDYIQADGTIPVGPSWLLPKKKNTAGGTTSYEGFDVVEFPKGGAESIRENKADIRDAVDRDNLLVKPAGAAGTDASTVAQTGVAKRLDSVAGNNLLGKIAAVLQRAETQIAHLVLRVLRGPAMGPTEAAFAKFTVAYPRSFDLVTVDEMAPAVAAFQLALASAGALPETEGRLFCRLARLMLPGLDDPDYEAIDKEIEAFLAQQVIDRAAARLSAGPTSSSGITDGTAADSGPAAAPAGPAAAAPAASPAPGPAAAP